MKIQKKKCVQSCLNMTEKLFTGKLNHNQKKKKKKKKKKKLFLRGGGGWGDGGMGG